MGDLKKSSPGLLKPIHLILLSVLLAFARGNPASKLKERILHPSQSPANTSLAFDGQELSVASAKSFIGRTLKGAGLSVLEPKRRFGTSGFGIDKGAPDLQFGLAFTVPFISLATDRLVSAISGKSVGGPLGGPGFGPGDLGSIFKLNVGGLVLAAVVGIGALLFFPAIFPNKFGSLFPGLSNFLPNILDQFGLGGIGTGWNKPFGPFGPYDSPGDYPYGAFSNQQNYREGPDDRARSLDDTPSNGTFWGGIASTVKTYASGYWKELESCADEAMCLRGAKDLSLKKEMESPDGVKRGRRGRRLDEVNLSPLDHILEAIQGMEKIPASQRVPLLPRMQKAYKVGNTGQDCSKIFPQCKLNPEQVVKVINGMGEYIFN